MAFDSLMPHACDPAPTLEEARQLLLHLEDAIIANIYTSPGSVRTHLTERIHALDLSKPTNRCEAIVDRGARSDVDSQLQDFQTVSTTLSNSLVALNNSVNRLALWPNDVDLSDSVISQYQDQICRSRNCRVTKDGVQDLIEQNSDLNEDHAFLSLLCLRVHSGKLVAESKFSRDSPHLIPLIQAGDRQGLMESITDTAVETQVLCRVRDKSMRRYNVRAGVSGFDSTNGVDTRFILAVFRDTLIPFTKLVQVEYLMQRLRGLP